MTCTRCGGKITFKKEDVLVTEIVEDNINVQIVGNCEFCDHSVIAGCEGELELISDHYLER